MYINLSRKHFFVWTVILVILICVSIFLVSITNKIEHGKKLIFDDNAINISSYYAEYEVTVISNKNVNTYFAKEWYKENVGNKIEYLDDTGNTVTVITTKDNVYIANSGNKLGYTKEGPNLLNNILALSTYINIFNTNITCECSKNIYLKNGKINIIYSFCYKDNCMQNPELKHIGVTGFELNVKDDDVETYIVYTGNKEEYVCIVYNKFNANILIEDDVFSREQE